MNDFEIMHLFDQLEDRIELLAKKTTTTNHIFAGGKVVINTSGIEINSDGAEGTYIKMTNEDLDAGYPNHYAQLNLQVDGGYPDGIVYFGLINDANNVAELACGKDEIIHIIEKAGAYRFVIEASYDIVKFNGLMRVPQLAADPVTAVENGCVYYNTTSHKFRGYANGGWTDLH